MQHDLIFHIVDKKALKKFKNDGVFKPESLEQEGFIHCSTGQQINDTANRLFYNQNHLLLLIIDVNRVAADIKFEEDADNGDCFPHIYGPLNTDAIMEKITINPNKEGDFDIEFTSN
jgi:uncharacterized protein (DUF952 family)